MSDGMRRIPCLLCDWRIAYDPAIPGLREHALTVGIRHYEQAHAGPPEPTTQTPRSG